ncbi:hypothetical protein [Tabrizicola sp.]|uniref:hypothetical protein n=1 Tax=Tabrizicola sp. TaxID=2005166 RepID=UPI003F3FDE00
MRQFVIKSFETIVWIVGGLIALVGVIMGFAALIQGQFQGLLLIIGGPLYAILLMGMVFIAIAIADNTKRTAEAIEKLAARGQ